MNEGITGLKLMLSISEGDWHSVSHNYAVGIWSIDIPEMSWCKNVCKGRWGFSVNKFWFKDKQDAIFFKLKWANRGYQ